MEKLCRQRLVVRKDESRPAGLLNKLCHGEGLAGTGDSKQYLMFFALRQATAQFVNGAALVALRLITADKLKIHTGYATGERTTAWLLAGWNQRSNTHPYQSAHRRPWCNRS